MGHKGSSGWIVTPISPGALRAALGTALPRVHHDTPSICRYNVHWDPRSRDQPPPEGDLHWDPLCRGWIACPAPPRGWGNTVCSLPPGDQAAASFTFPSPRSELPPFSLHAPPGSALGLGGVSVPSPARARPGTVGAEREGAGGACARAARGRELL